MWTYSRHDDANLTWLFAKYIKLTFNVQIFLLVYLYGHIYFTNRPTLSAIGTQLDFVNTQPIKTIGSLTDGTKVSAICAVIAQIHMNSPR